MKQRKWGGCCDGTARTRRSITTLISADGGWKMQVLMHRVTQTRELGPGSRLRRGFLLGSEGSSQSAAAGAATRMNCLGPRALFRSCEAYQVAARRTQRSLHYVDGSYVYCPEHISHRFRGNFRPEIGPRTRVTDQRSPNETRPFQDEFCTGNPLTNLNFLG